MPVFTVNDTVTENAGNRSLGDYLLILILRSTDNETQTSVGTVFAFTKTCRTCFVISFFFCFCENVPRKILCTALFRLKDNTGYLVYL